MRREAVAKPAPVRPALRTSPNWALLALSGAGIALAGYLAWTAFNGSSVKGCSVGSACDVVLTSRWANLFGLPTALWGLFAYAALAAIAFVKRVDRHWQYAWIAAMFGLCYSLYLTAVSLTILDAACPYCLTSLAIMTAIFAVVTRQRPSELAKFSWMSWVKKTIPVTAAIIVLLHLNYTGVLGEPPAAEDPLARGLAEHLSTSGAKFYGASWCPHCQDQKSIFGQAARRLPYVECSPGGQGTPQASECVVANIETYPTWIINGKRIEEVLSLQRLADASGFKAPPSDLRN